MAITEKGQLKAWFNTRLYPTAEQFWAWLDSYWHKNEKLPLSAVEDLDAVIDRQNARISVIEGGSTPQNNTLVPDIQIRTDNGKIYYKLTSQYAGLDLDQCTLELGMYKRYNRTRTLQSGEYKNYIGRKYCYTNDAYSYNIHWTDVRLIPPTLDISASDIILGREQEYPYAARDITDRVIYFVNPDGSLTTFSNLYDAGASVQEIEQAMRVPCKPRGNNNRFNVYTDTSGNIKFHYTILCELCVGRVAEVELIDGYTHKVQLYGTPVRFRVKVWNEGRMLHSTIKLTPVSVQNGF